MTSHISSVMGFLTTSLHKNCQNDVKLLETWWFWPILGKVERAELTCDVIKKSCSTFLIKFWLYLRSWTCALTGFFWLLSHVIYLKLTKVLIVCFLSQTEWWVVKVLFLSLRPEAWTFYKPNFVNPLRFTSHQKKLRKLFTF